ncbi:MAG: DUF3606 domain-containing protein [Rubrivivax sp.]
MSNKTKPVQGHRDSPSDRIDPADEASVQRWREHFGVTAAQLEEAVQAVGDDPVTVREHLLNQGASSGPG